MRKNLVVLALVAAGGLGAWYLWSANETASSPVEATASSEAVVSDASIGDAGVETYANIALV